ncbi:NACHT domain-containing protein [Amycolatopsis sp. NPDC059657]|uniref:NACHT domain-containing protein n=1 Tax=Amycolatopsis sp. NPDC059657 TaxID=3346899 RepID=UPI00366C272B
MKPVQRSRPLSPTALSVASVVTIGFCGWFFEIGYWFFGFVALGVGAALVYVERTRTTPTTSTPTTQIVGSAVTTAAAAWTAQLEERGVFEWHTLPLRWRKVGEHPPSAAATYTWNRVDDFYRNLETRRLIILGAPGAGKTVLAIQLARQLLEAWNGTERFPLFVSLSSWNPAEVRFPDWLKDRLATSYPSLSALDATGRRIADSLVDEHKVLPVLDGLDELSRPLRVIALAAITRMAPFPFVLTCQTVEYAALTDTTTPPRDVVAVEIEPLRAADVRAYMTAGERVPGSMDELLRDEGNPLLRMLSTPLMCFLMKVGYTGAPGQTQELAALAEKSPAALEAYLLKRFVPALFDTGRRGPKQIHDWGADRATRWLSYLARDLVRRKERDLVPWRLHESLVDPGAAGIVLSGVVSGGVLGVVIGLGGAAATAVLRLLADRFGIVAEPSPLFPTSWALVLAGSAIAALLVLQSTRTRAIRNGSTRFSSRGAHYAIGGMVRLLVGILGGAGIVLLSRFSGALGLVAFSGGLMMGMITTALADWSREWRVGRSPRRIRIRIQNIPDAVVYGLGGGLLTALGAAVLIGFEAGALVAAAAVTVGVVINLLDEQVDERQADRAASVLASDRWATTLQLASVGAVVGVFTEFVREGGATAPLVFGIGLGTGAGLALGVAAAVLGGLPVLFPSTVWVRYLTAKWWLASGKHVPIRLIPFLDDACTLGVLRRVGAVYQFRHIDLQRHLSGPTLDRRNDS